MSTRCDRIWLWIAATRFSPAISETVNACARVVQVLQADERLNSAKEAARVAESKVTDLDFKFSQSERRLSETQHALREAQRRADEAMLAARDMEGRAKAMEQTALENERRVVDWERQLSDADRALTVTESRVQVRALVVGRVVRAMAGRVQRAVGLRQHSQQHKAETPVRGGLCRACANRSTIRCRLVARPVALRTSGHACRPTRGPA